MTDTTTPATADNLLNDRLTLLLVSLPGNTQNYSRLWDAAAWVILEAGRVGWILTIEPKEEGNNGR